MAESPIYKHNNRESDRSSSKKKKASSIKAATRKPFIGKTIMHTLKDKYGIIFNNLNDIMKVVEDFYSELIFLLQGKA